MLHPDIIESFTDGYAVATLWANTQGACDCEDTDTCPGHQYTGDHYAGLDGFTEDSQVKIREECAAFVLSNVADILAYGEARRFDPRDGDVWAHAGHDFALSRNGHGTGFWDRGLGDLGRRLNDAADAWGEVNPWEPEDGSPVEYE